MTAKHTDSRLHFLRRLHSEERGVVAIIFAFVLIPLIGMLALTVDLGFGYGQRRMAQNVADSGAVAATKVVAANIAIPGSQRDAGVWQAIRDVSGRSSGGFVSLAGGAFTDRFTAEYVDQTLSSLGSAGTGGVLCPNGVTTGCIPSAARGVRVTSQKSNAAFFATALGFTQIAAGARATALASPITGAWGPYAIWGGELEHRCPDPSDPTGYEQDPYNPGNWRYGCIPPMGGTYITGNGSRHYDTTKPTEVMIRSTNWGASPNIVNGDTQDANGYKRWRVTDNRFKGFLHAASGYPDLINVNSPTPVDAQGGVSGGNQPLAMIDDCYANRNPPNAILLPGTGYGTDCTLVMPIIVEAQDLGSTGVSIRVSSFVGVKLLHDSSGPSATDWTARIMPGSTILKLSVTSGAAPDPNAPTAYYVRLVQ